MHILVVIANKQMAFQTRTSCLERQGEESPSPVLVLLWVGGTCLCLLRTSVNVGRATASRPDELMDSPDRFLVFSLDL